MAEELSIISFGSNEEAVFEIEGNILKENQENLYSDGEFDFNDMNKEILSCLDKLIIASRKNSSQSVRSEDENSFTNFNLKSIWGEENKDDSGTFMAKFESLKKKKSKKPKTKFSHKQNKDENFAEKEIINKTQNYETHHNQDNVYITSGFEPIDMAQINQMYSNSHNHSPIFNSTDMRRLKQNFSMNMNGAFTGLHGMNINMNKSYQTSPPMYSRVNIQITPVSQVNNTQQAKGTEVSNNSNNVYAKRNFFSQNSHINDEQPLNRMLQYNNQNKYFNKMNDSTQVYSNNKIQNTNFKTQPNFYSKGKKANDFQGNGKNENQGKDKYLDDESNRINLENVLRKRDKRTTVMIRHIPNKYNIKTFLEEINQEFENKYDIFYLPIDYVNNCNLGFAFINFVDPMHTILFYERFRGRKWKRFNSEKICELAYAKFQGKKELIAHFEKGSVLNFVSEEKRPLILPTPNPLPKVELPIKFTNAFITIYPYAVYSLTGKDTITIEAFYSF